MKKFFIKHRNIIMALVSVALMLSFSLLSSNPGKKKDELASTPVGKLDGKTVTVSDVDAYKSELDLLAEYGILSRDHQGFPYNLWAAQGGDDSKIGLFWYLLCQDAQRYVVVPVGNASAVSTAASRSGYKEADVISRLNAASIQQEFLAQALTHLYTVDHYLNFLGFFPTPISAVELTADRMLRKIQVAYAPIDATQGWQDIKDADVAGKLQAQFDAYKDVLATRIPGSADPPFFLGIGNDGHDYALIGYPGSVVPPAHIHEKELIPWDGCRINAIYHPDSIVEGVGLPAGADLIQISGGGRNARMYIGVGKNIHNASPLTLPAEVNGHHFPFGYKSPQQVKVEYLMFPRQNLRGRLTVNEADADAARAEFKKDPYKFRPRPSDSQPATSLNVAAPGATQPETAPATTRSEKDVRKDWDIPEVRQPYLDEQLDLRTTRVLKKLVDSARAKADAPWKSIGPPDKSLWVSYASMAQAAGNDVTEETGRISGFRRWFSSLGFGPYTPVHNTGKDFLSAEQLFDVPGIGHAIYQNAQGQVFDFPTLATHVLELNPPDKSTPLGRLELEVGHECPEVTDGQGNVYLFRVTEYKQSKVPDSLAEVRDQVVEDCKQRLAFENTQAAVTAALKKTADVKALAEQYHSQVRTPEPFAHEGQVPPPPEVAAIRDFLDAAFKLPDPTASAPAITTVAAEESLRLYPLRVMNVEPAKGADFREKIGDIYGAARQSPAMSTFLVDYLKLETLAARVKYAKAESEPWPIKPPTTHP